MITVIHINHPKQLTQHNESYAVAEEHITRVHNIYLTGKHKLY